MITEEDKQTWYLLHNCGLNRLNTTRSQVNIPLSSVLSRRGDGNCDIFFANIVIKADGKINVTTYLKSKKYLTQYSSLHESLDFIHEQWEEVYATLSAEEKEAVKSEFVPPDKSTKQPTSNLLTEEDVLSLL
jgi:hypothetical protein